MRATRARRAAWICIAFGACVQALAADNESPPPAKPAVQDELQEVIVTAAEPRYVVPTQRDRIGRIWAPVYLNGQGPFRMVLDSGASSSGITDAVVQRLQLSADPKRHVLLRGVTGTATVSTTKVNNFTVGDLSFGPAQLPIITDALGGADGILGTDHMGGRRITVQFRHDLIIISRSHGERAPAGYVTVPFQLLRGNLLAVDATVGSIPTKAIIDTGGQVTIANLALRARLAQRKNAPVHPEKIIGVTDDVQEGDAISTPALRITPLERDRTLQIRFSDVTFGDMHIFEHWHLTDTPAMLIGMDALGYMDVLVIDYRRHELQILMPDGS